MSHISNVGSGGIGGSGIQTVTGNNGGAVPGDINDNIFLLGSGSVVVSGNIGVNTLTITDNSTTLVTTTPYVVLASDNTILVDTTTIGAPSTIQLPDAPTVDGRSWTVKDWSGDATAFPITVTTVSGTTPIDGGTTSVISVDFESITFTYSVSEATYSIVYDFNPEPGVITIDGDAGSATGTIITLTGGSSGAFFTGAGSTLTESFNYLSLPATDNVGNGQILIDGSAVFQTYGNSDIFIGVNSGNFTTTGNDNTSVGNNALPALTNGAYNVAVGNYALRLLETGQVNTAIGYQALAGLVSGGGNCGFGENTLLQVVDGYYNLAMGQFAGANYTTTESSNITFNHGGVTAESNTLRIGGATGTGNQELAAAYICGIDGVDVGSVVRVVTEDSDQLGTADLTAGNGITITPTSNAITISANGSVASYTAITDADSPYTVLTSDYYISVDSSGAPVTLLFPDAATAYQSFIVKDRTGSALANNITLTTVGGVVLLDGGTSFVMNSNYESVNLLGNGTSYEVF